MLYTAPALADMILPPPKDCPSGRVGITSHDGPQCIKEAPDNCPPGWKGVRRGLCKVHTCGDSSSCDNDGVCVDAMVCFNEYLDYPHWRVCPPSPPIAPGQPKPVVKPHCQPRKKTEAVNLCSPQQPCKTGECRLARVCVPTKGSLPHVMPWKLNGKVDNRPPKGGSCAGCGLPARTVAFGSCIALLLAIALLFLRRRRANSL